MFTWISRAAALLVLAGCVSTGLGGGTGSLALTDDAVQIVGPTGFCVDPEEVRDSGNSGFVLFGNCASITQSRLSRQPALPAVLTAAVSEPSTGGGITQAMDTLSEFFGTPDGRAVLSRTGDEETVEVQQSFSLEDVFYLRATDTSPGVVPGTRDSYWRAYFDLGDRIVTLSILALDQGPEDSAAELNLLEDFVAETRASNLVAAPIAQETTPERTGLFNSGFFRRILG